MLWLTATLAAVSITLLPKVALTQGCWMQTSNGRIIDLGYLCRGGTSRLPAHPPRESTTPKPIKPVERVSIFVSELRYEGNLLVGRVTNASDRAVDRVRVYYEVLDNFGRIAGAGWNYTTPEILQPGQTAVFRDVVYPQGARVQTTAIAWGLQGITTSLFSARHIAAPTVVPLCLIRRCNLLHYDIQTYTEEFVTASAPQMVAVQYPPRSTSRN